eukprot:CAMPEP_0117537046 /NCGR_PEP_ID=MMETSP0784-20121206/41765_1 /TAXON_ID=39447 /ORGANISM="" /LENGTH=161 /DNA_ID=CAMNT_0005333625 /DNA_START=116 /DNA_END=600 /DNA_ORIENTATION=-
MRHIALLLLFGVAGGARRRQMGEVTDEVANTKTVASAEHMLDNRPLQYFGRPAGEGAAGSATKPQEVPPVTMAPDASASRAMADAPRRGRHNEWFASLSELGSRVRSTAMDIQRSRFDQVLILTVALRHHLRLPVLLRESPADWDAPQAATSEPLATSENA